MSRGREVKQSIFTTCEGQQKPCLSFAVSGDHQAYDWRLVRPKRMEDLDTFSGREIMRAAAAEERVEYSSVGH